MKKIAPFLIALLLGLNTSEAQIAKKVNYAKTEILVPSGYNSGLTNEISGENFTVQWFTISEVMYQKNVHKQMIRRMESEQHGKFISGIQFFSQGVPFTGRIYQVKSDTAIKYRVLAYGVINKQPLVINMGFVKEPKQNTDLDDFMLKFIDFEK